MLVYVDESSMMMNVSVTMVNVITNLNDLLIITKVLWHGTSVVLRKRPHEAFRNDREVPFCTACRERQLFRRIDQSQSHSLEMSRASGLTVRMPPVAPVRPSNLVRTLSASVAKVHIASCVRKRPDVQTPQNLCKGGHH